jgi:hypothetical protein
MQGCVAAVEADVKAEQGFAKGGESDRSSSTNHDGTNFTGDVQF